MPTCPLCRTNRNYAALLFLRESGTLDCKQCGIFLRAKVEEKRLLRYALVTGAVAALLAFTVVLSRNFSTTISLLLAWTLMSWSAYPLVLVLVPDQRQASSSTSSGTLQTESK